MPMDKERRQAPRFSIKQMIQLGEGTEEFLWARSLNLSKIGLGCLSSKPLQPLDRVFGMVTVQSGEDSRDISFEGYVVRSKPVDEGYELGIAFTEISSEDAVFLDTCFDSPESP